MRGKSIAGLMAAALAVGFGSLGSSYYEPGFGLGSRGSSRRRGPGWTNAHAKRMARKRRNVLRNRKAHR